MGGGRGGGIDEMMSERIGGGCVPLDARRLCRVARTNLPLLLLRAQGVVTKTLSEEFNKR